MEYKNATACCGESTSRLPVPVEPVTEVLHSVNRIGLEACAFAEKIETQLFGFQGRNREEKFPEPACFADELAMHRRVLSETVEVLMRLCERIGV